MMPIWRFRSYAEYDGLDCMSQWFAELEEELEITGFSRIVRMAFRIIIREVESLEDPNTSGRYDDLGDRQEHPDVPDCCLGFGRFKFRVEKHELRVLSRVQDRRCIVLLVGSLRRPEPDYYAKLCAEADTRWQRLKTKEAYSDDLYL